ncbi:MAG: hypothetical protein GY746_02740 [Gammaproteobacteria bacterium]|nr:hypothetical protein [Gammaproteobacteria bacterium]
MNDIVLMGDGAELPEHLKQYGDEAQKAADMVGGFNSGPRLSIRGKQFRFEKEGEEVIYPAGQPLEVFILASDPPQGTAKSFYKAAYTSGNDDMPDCFSSDGIEPDAFVEHPQARTCTECPNNAFGSGTDAAGKPSKGKACGDHKNLFVVEASNVNSEIFCMRVPPTSLRALSQYGRKLAKYRVAPAVMVTKLSFTDEVHPQLEFKEERYATDVEAPVTISRSNSQELHMLLPSENKMAPPARDEETLALGAPPAHVELPAPPAQEKVLTEKAGTTTYEGFIEAGWSDNQLIEHGYMELK